MINPAETHLKCHRLVSLAVAESMSPSTRALVFARVVFQLNAAFPSQSTGRPFLDAWASCEEFASQVTSVLDCYFVHRDDLAAPILLCEVVARCAWFVAIWTSMANHVDLGILLIVH